ncbi:MAG: hypothetical protein AAFR81_14630 [Chloroflexota bacterium]
MRLRYLLACLMFTTLIYAVAAQDDDFPFDTLEDGAIEIEEVDLDIEEEFDDDDAWEFYEDPDSSAEVDDGTYQIQRDFSDSWLWAYGDDEYEDSVIRVETEQLSDDDLNWYGVMCRADVGRAFEGYGFFISGDGRVRIAVAVDGETTSLIDESSDAVEGGQDENEIIAVCAGEYLALYVNDELVAEVEDDTFDEGVTGFAAISLREDEEIHVAFDNLFVWEIDEFSEADDDGDERTSSTSTSRDDNPIDVDDLQDDVEDALEEGDESIDLEDVVIIETWDEEGDWVIYEDDESDLRVDSGAYILTETDSGTFIWGENRTEHNDMVLTVTAEQLSDTSVSGYGVMCRLDPDNLEDGYAFVISGDGFYTVGYWEDNEYNSLLDTEDGWDTTNDTNEGDDVNQLTVVCVDEYLALYANGELLFETEDDTYDEGYTAMAVVAFNDEEIEVAFDNLVIWEADN